MRFNNVSTYLAFEVVTTFHLKKRAALLKHLILTARRCYEHNNFHGLMAILSALRYCITSLSLSLSLKCMLTLRPSNSAVARLKRTWKALPNSVRAMYMQLEDITDPKGNFQAYRQAFKRITPPAIPYFGTFMSLPLSRLL